MAASIGKSDLLVDETLPKVIESTNSWCFVACCGISKNFVQLSLLCILIRLKFRQGNLTP